MKYDEIIALLNPQNPLLNNGCSYRSSFEKNINLVTFSTNTILEKLGNTQNVDSTVFLSEYRQGVAEFLVWFWFINNNIQIEIEKNKNTSNGSNVDVVFEYKGMHFNVEVKSPVIPDRHNDNKIHPILSNRLGGTVDDVKESFAKLFGEIDEKSKQAGYDGIEELELPRDNKIKDTLLSCQNKFCNPSQTEINILFIATSSGEMINYWNYIVNEAGTGFFQNGSFLSHSSFNKVNAIILSNCISLNEKYNDDSWDLSKAVNIVLTNPNCSNFDEFINNWRNVYNCFPDDTPYFVEFLENAKNKQEYKDFPNMVLRSMFLEKKGFNKLD